MDPVLPTLKTFPDQRATSMVYFSLVLSFHLDFGLWVRNLSLQMLPLLMCNDEDKDSTENVRKKSKWQQGKWKCTKQRWELQECSSLLVQVHNVQPLWKMFWWFVAKLITTISTPSSNWASWYLPTWAENIISTQKPEHGSW